MSGEMTTPANVGLVFERLALRGAGPALVADGREISAAELIELSHLTASALQGAGVPQGAIVAFQGDYAPATVALFLAMMRAGLVAVPFTTALTSEREALARIAGVEWWVDAETRQVERAPTPAASVHPLIAGLRATHHPGLVVFTSGSAGKPKAILHDIDRVASKFVVERRGWRTVLFLLMDHFGGFNTLMGCLVNNGVGVCVADRAPESVCRTIEQSRAELLATTPTFLGMLIASGTWRAHDLSSLKLITYGAEPMPPATLKRLGEVFPGVELKQTYGLSELGVLRSASPDPHSLWLKVGGDGFETRIVDGQLHIRSRSNMLGYLNAPSPIDVEGWMNTGDIVEEQDGLIRFLGRSSEVINVGGQKVFPTEVEAALLEADNIADATVYGVPHPLLGHAVAARLALNAPEEAKAVADRLRSHCRQRLQKFKVPMRFEIVEAAALATDRAKKRRATLNEQPIGLDAVSRPGQP